VTQQAFEAFLADVADISKGRSVPTVLFGRTGAAEDAWLILSESGLAVPVLEIGFYGRDASIDFAEARLRSLLPEKRLRGADRTALELLLDRLRGQTESDGDRFAGYAPVLQAVAERVAKENNPAALVAEIQRGGQTVTLQTIVSAILERERGKLTLLSFEDPGLLSRLYSSEEQLDRLVARVYKQPMPQLPRMGPKDADTYSVALATWVGEHPFLDGGISPSSAVFEAVISTRALQNPAMAELALERELTRGAAANPFLSELYLPEPSSEPVHLRPEFIGIMYASLRARLSLGDTANLLVEGSEDAEEEEALRAEVEISLARRDADRPRVLRFETEQTGRIRLGAHVEDVDVAVPHTTVEIGFGTEAMLIAPVSIQCGTLSFVADKVIVEAASAGESASVYLEAGDYDGPRIASVPTLRGSVSLSASWPGVMNFPWTSFATEPTPPVNPRVDEALRRLRKFITAFRSHSRGALARYRHKIESERMTKGGGRAVLHSLVRENILTLRGNYYFLDAARLASHAGTNYRDANARRFSAQAIAFAERALANEGNR
jgi:hypothetical protein